MIRVLLAITLGFCSLQAYAQQGTTHRCATDEVNEQIYRNDQDARATRDALEMHTRQFIQQQQMTPSLPPAQKTNAWGGYKGKTKYVIPVVVHVVYGNDPQLRDSISLCQARSQFPVLFEGYRKVPGTPGFGAGADYEVEFQLATKDPQGNPTTGVVYHYDVNQWAQNRNMHGQMKQTYTWDKTKYCHIWVCIDAGGGAAAYALYPGSSSSQDGVVCGAQYFGSNRFCPNGWYQTGAAEGLTITHELGHWLNLPHVFGNSNTSGDCGGSNCNSSGDYVCDTPPSLSRHFTLSDRRRMNTCTNDNPDNADDFRNYMDYSSDNLHDLFTQGQKTRSYASLAVSGGISQRFNLWQDVNLQNTGTGPWNAPKANFWSNNQTVCAGAPVTFIDYSASIPTRYRWEFPGGTVTTPGADTTGDPQVIYTQPGTYDVKLWVTNFSGVEDSIVKTGFITVTDTTYALPFAEGFENVSGSNTPPQDWHIVNPDFGKLNPGEARTWTVSGINGGFGASAKSMRFPNFVYGDYDQFDDMVSPKVSTQGAANLTLSFTRAYATAYTDEGFVSSSPGDEPNRAGFGRVYTDSLYVSVSNDCGNTWTQVYKKGGVQLATRPFAFTLTEFGSSSNRVSSSQWARDSISLDAFVGSGDPIRVRFTNRNGFGNNLFIDDVALDPIKYTPRVDTVPVDTTPPDAVNPMLHHVDMAVYPNPTQNRVNVQLYTGLATDLVLSLTDAMGRTVLAPRGYSAAPGRNAYELSLEGLSPGVYWLQAAAGEKRLSTRILLVP